MCEDRPRSNLKRWVASAALLSVALGLVITVLVLRYENRSLRRQLEQPGPRSSRLELGTVLEDLRLSGLDGEMASLYELASEAGVAVVGFMTCARLSRPHAQ